MGKHEKVKKAKRRIPFYKEKIDENVRKPTSRIKMRDRQENYKTTVIDSKLTQIALTEAQQLLDDINEEVELDSLCKDFQSFHLFAGLPEEKDGEVYYKKENVLQENFLEETECKENSMSDDLVKKATLPDLLREKITEKRTETNTIFSDAGCAREENAKLLSKFKKVATVLSHYRSGKIPKRFKAIPKYAAWEHLLSLTEPANWTAAAMFQATVIFSSAKIEIAERFYNLILLPRLRDEIAQWKILHDILYRAVQKALHRPRAFFKGIILPLCESGFTEDEAATFADILSESSAGVILSKITLMHITRMSYSCTNCLFMRALLEMEYALHCKVIDEVVDYFLKFAKDDKPLPVVWHQCLLTFVQSYKNKLSQDQLEELLNLLKNQNHPEISVETRKELLSVNCLNRETSVNKT